eukprot:1385447-Amorphochlora_amoeboformis.AAC.1
MSEKQPVVPFGFRILADAIAAYTAGAAVSPVITGVDRALAENASGRGLAIKHLFFHLGRGFVRVRVE